MKIFRMDRDSQVVRNTRFATAIRDATSRTKKSDLLKTGAPARDVFPFFFLAWTINERSVDFTYYVA